jgi:hypothetical protein
MIVHSQIEDLVRHHAGARVDTVWFIDQLLGALEAKREVRCTLAGSGGLRFEFRDEEAFEVPLDLAKSKLRAMCARLGVLCNESGGEKVSLYGGEGTIQKEVPVAVANGPGSSAGSPFEPCPRRWTVRFKNTPSEQEFIIQAQ